MKNITKYLIVSLFFTALGFAQNYEFGVVNISGNTFKVVAIPDFNTADSNPIAGNTDIADVGFTLMLPAGTSDIQNVSTMLAGRTWNLNSYDAAFLTGQGLGDGTKDAFLLTMNPGQSLVTHVVDAQIDLMSFEVVNPPSSGDLYFLDNTDPIAQGAGNVLDSFFNADIDGIANGAGTVDYYGGNDPSLESYSFGTTSDFVVNTTDDTDDVNTSDGICEDINGNCSLRAALQSAAFNSDFNTIGFNIPGAGPHTITLGSTFTPIFNPVSIDATTQPDYTQGNPLVILNGNALDFGFAFLTNSSGSEVKGLSMVNFNLYAIHAQSTDSHTIEENFIGVETDGVTVNSNFTGIRLEDSDGNTVHNNLISGNTAVGLLIDTGSQNNSVTGNFIGTSSDGTTAIGNYDNIVIDDASNNTIGGINPEDRNIISGALDTNDQGEGVNINGSTATGNLITGNYIGTDVTGQSSLQNAFAGVLLHAEANGNTISNNVIAGNFDSNFNSRSGVGIQVSGVGTDNNIIQNNKIGANVDGTIALPNRSGIDIQLGPTGTLVLDNLISGNQNSGIEMGNDPMQGALPYSNVIQGNLIGLTSSGSSALPNLVGITISNSNQNLIGGDQLAQRNYISGNTLDGIRVLDASSTEIFGNYIGLDTSGLGLGNGQHGVWIDGFDSDSNYVGSTNTGEGNVISGNVANGVLISNDAGLNLVVGNLIGTNASGTGAIGNDVGVELNNAVLNLVSDNIISGNTDFGLGIFGSGSTDNLVYGNYIGTDISGTIGIPNFYGIEITNANDNSIGGSLVGEGNIISAQLGDAIRLSNADNNSFKQNLIGLQVDGTSALGNGNNGILIYNGSANNTVGGFGANDANIIGFNNRGVNITPGPPGFPAPLGNKVSRNKIFNNTNIGIDLGTVGMTSNDVDDADSGSNKLQNFPIIVNDAEINGTDITITYSIDSDPTNSTYPLEVEFFIDDTNAQGKEFLFTDSYTSTDYGNGFKTVTLPLPAGSTFLAGQNILSTATDAEGNTSEFGNTVTVNDATLSDNDISIEGLQIFPNPVSETLIVISSEDIDRLELYSIHGKLEISIENKNQVAVNKLSAGLYLLKITIGDKQVTKRIVVKR